MSFSQDSSLMPLGNAYTALNPTQTLEVDEIATLRSRLLQNIAEINNKKYSLSAGDYNQLKNYHYYALNILNNMLNIKHVQMSNPYNRNMEMVNGNRAQPGIENLNPYNQLTMMTLPGGQSQIMTKNDYSKTLTKEWENQFDENVINPPCYTLPPSNCWNLPQRK